MRNDQKQVSQPDTATSEATDQHRVPENAIAPVTKAVVMGAEPGKYVDSSVVAFRYYNSFNYSLLAKDQPGVNLTLGITSSNPAEGKTLVASNLAVSLSLGFQRKTVLVDLNIQKPRLHELFGTSLHPGLVEALHNGSIHVSPTKVEHLAVLSAGSLKGNPIGLGQLAAFRHVIWSLQKEFEFVIVDMPSLKSGNFPILFANQLNGILVVVDARKTLRRDIDKVFRHLHEEQVFGFVFNRVVENNF